MTAWDGMNRRKFPRVTYPCLITLRQDMGEVDVILTHTENIGIGGVGVIIKKSLKMFAPVELEIDLLDTEDHVKCQGKIVWSIRRKSEETIKPLYYDIGIEFNNINPKDQERLDQVIRRLAKQER